MALATPDSDDLLGQRFARTAAGEQAALGGSGLSRRALTLLRLLDGTTPLAVFAEHLKRYDVASLASELLTDGLIIAADESRRGRRNLGRFSLGTLLPSLRRDVRDPTTERALPEANDADQTESEEAPDTEADDLTVRLMNRYAPSLEGDAEIDQAFRNNNSGKQEP